MTTEYVEGGTIRGKVVGPDGKFTGEYSTATMRGPGYVADKVFGFDQIGYELGCGHAVMRKDGGPVWYENDGGLLGVNWDGCIMRYDFTDEDRDTVEWVQVVSLPNGCGWPE